MPEIDSVDCAHLALLIERSEVALVLFQHGFHGVVGDADGHGAKVPGVRGSPLSTALEVTDIYC